jgi:hypothetical protein
LKALIIDEPWIGKILRGEKTWEMRKTVCHLRGPIALIRKGSGMVVGTAELTDSLSPIATRREYSEAEAFHGVPPERQDRAFTDGWMTPWVLAKARPLSPAVAYQHPSGAVIWVNLDDAVTAAVNRQVGVPVSPSAPIHAQVRADAAPTMPKPTRPKSSDRAQPMQDAASLSVETRRVVVTGGNVRNNHIYLPLDFFPDDAIGGSNKSVAAPRSISVTFEPGVTVETDIDRSKRILRTRGPVGDFLARAGVNDGDTVLIIRHSPYAYTISKAQDV